jgi:hypothetical protein
MASNSVPRAVRATSDQIPQVVAVGDVDVDLEDVAGELPEYDRPLSGGRKRIHKRLSSADTASFSSDEGAKSDTKDPALLSGEIIHFLLQPESQARAKRLAVALSSTKGGPFWQRCVLSDVSSERPVLEALRAVVREDPALMRGTLIFVLKQIDKIGLRDARGGLASAASIDDGYLGKLLGVGHERLRPLIEAMGRDEALMCCLSDLEQVTEAPVTNETAAEIDKVLVELIQVISLPLFGMFYTIFCRLLKCFFFFHLRQS